MATECHKFYCTQCGKEGIPVVRKNGNFREKGHLKKLWCLNCKQETNHAEITAKYTVDMFLYEFNHNNFVNGDRVVKMETILKQFQEEK